MTNFTTVFPSVGATRIAVDGDYVMLEQDPIDDIEKPEVIWIPRVLFREVMGSIFARLYPSELRGIAELAELFAEENKEG